MQYTTREVEPDIRVVEFAGQLSLGNRLLDIESSIKDTVLKDCRKLVLDVTQLTYIDSAGIGMLALCAGTVQRSGGRVHLALVDGKVKNMITLVRLDQIVALYPDAASACAAFAHSATA